MGMRTEYDIVVGYYTDDSLICIDCAHKVSRTELETFTYATVGSCPDGFTCAECDFVQEPATQMFTVTATGTYFVEATNAFEAECIVYEAMLGNDSNGVRCLETLGNGEVHGSMKVEKGYHSTIPDEMYGITENKEEN